MILLLHKLLLAWGWKLPAVFTYVSTRVALSALTALLVSVSMGPRFIRRLYELKIGQQIRIEECPLLGELHKKKQDTPTMGGLLILFSMLVAMALWMNLQHAFTFVFLVTTAVLGTLGALDDRRKLQLRNAKGMRSRTKFAMQVLLGAFLACYLLLPSVTELFHWGSWFAPPQFKEGSWLGLHEAMARLYIPFLKHPLLVFSGAGLMLMGLLMVFVVAGTSNAVSSRVSRMAAARAAS